MTFDVSSLGATSPTSSLQQSATTSYASAPAKQKAGGIGGIFGSLLGGLTGGGGAGGGGLLGGLLGGGGAQGSGGLMGGGGPLGMVLGLVTSLLGGLFGGGRGAASGGGAVSSGMLGGMMAGGPKQGGDVASAYGAPGKHSGAFDAASGAGSCDRSGHGHGTRRAGSVGGASGPSAGDHAFGRNLLARFDTDQDGKLNRTELLATVTALNPRNTAAQNARFTDAVLFQKDGNQDGSLDAGEIADVLATLRRGGSMPPMKVAQQSVQAITPDTSTDATPAVPPSTDTTVPTTPSTETSTPATETYVDTAPSSDTTTSSGSSSSTSDSTAPPDAVTTVV